MLLILSGNNQEKIIQLRTLFAGNEEGITGISELEFILEYQGATNIEIDLTLARGLNYYTGIIYEVKATKVSIGSIGGGGRYDDLTGLFGIPSIPGVGISFGVDRIYDVMEELSLFPEDLQTSTKVLFFNMGVNEARFAYKQVLLLRDNGISCEIYHEPVKLEKQFKYAERKNIPYVVIIGSQEMNENNCIIKNLGQGNQDKVALTDLPGVLKTL